MEALEDLSSTRWIQESYLTLGAFASSKVNIGLESGASSPHSILEACDHEISGGDDQIILMKGHCCSKITQVVKAPNFAQSDQP